MTEFYNVKIAKRSYLVCREKPARGRPTLTVYCDKKSPPKLRRRIEKAIVDARQ
jgi:hypothetical protein